MTAIATIVREVARIRRVPIAELRSPRRGRAIASARQESMYLAKSLTKASMTTIGAVLKRDHTTVLHGIRAVEKRIDDVFGYGDEIETIGAAIVPLLEVHDEEDLRDLLIGEATRPLEQRIVELERRMKGYVPIIVERPSEPVTMIVRETREVLPAPVLQALAYFEQHRFGHGERFAIARLLKTLHTARRETRGEA